MKFICCKHQKTLKKKNSKTKVGGFWHKKIFRLRLFLFRLNEQLAEVDVEELGDLVEGFDGGLLVAGAPLETVVLFKPNCSASQWLVLRFSAITALMRFSIRLAMVTKDEVKKIARNHYFLTDNHTVHTGKELLTLIAPATKATCAANDYCL